MRTKWTNIKLFNQIVENLREQGKLPDILEYSEPAFNEMGVGTWVEGCVDSRFFEKRRGGFHLIIYLVGESNIVKLGTFKTLKDDYESWTIMVRLSDDFQQECMRFINEHMEDFEEVGE